MAWIVHDTDVIAIVSSWIMQTRQKKVAIFKKEKILYTDCLFIY